MLVSPFDWQAAPIDMRYAGRSSRRGYGLARVKVKGTLVSLIGSATRRLDDSWLASKRQAVRYQRLLMPHGKQEA